MGKKNDSALIADMEHCMVCGAPHPHKHHVFGAANRNISEKYGYYVPLCYQHHEGKQSPHMDREIDLRLKRMAQQQFESERGTREDFIKIFGKSWM